MSSIINNPDNPNVSWQPQWPIRFGHTGPYRSVGEVKASIQQNLTFLFYTAPGEWPGNPDIGIGLRKFLFEPLNSPQFQILESRIRNQIAKYLPPIAIEEIKVRDSAREENAVSIFFSYSIPHLGEEESIQLIFNINTGPGAWSHGRFVENPTENRRRTRNEVIPNL